MIFAWFCTVCGNLRLRANLCGQPVIEPHINFPVSGSGMPALYRLLTVSCFAFMIVVFTACGNSNNKGTGLAGGVAPVLLFNGTGASLNDVDAIRTILDSEHLNYFMVNSPELNGMGRSQFMKYRLLIVPGGDFMDMGNSLTTGAAANIRYAVQRGLNYLGICAGGFLAGNSAYYNGFNLTSGVTFGFYSAENKGIRKAAVAITSPGAPTLDQYWEDGPQLSGWGMVVAKYPDGTPAVTEGKYGTGFLILAGIHAEAPAEWRGGMVFKTSVSADNAYAVKLIHAALNGASLPYY
ncbi:MAG: BPL-N domain-containing protein [Bacteroidota bacterium]|nr:BPL-N domain-containing protein [Bacteroidota bacterium]